MKERPFIVLGGGGHASVVISTLRLLGASVLGFTDPSPQASARSSLKHLGDDGIIKKYAPDDVHCAIGLGSTQNSAHRARLFEEQRDMGFSFPAIIHPSACVAPEAKLGAGAQVMAGAVIQAGAVLAENVIVNTNASIDHDCRIHAHVHVAPGSVLSGNVQLETGVHVGTGAVLIQGVHVGAQSVIGAGATVIDDIPPKTTVVGTPARPIKHTHHE